MNSTQVLDFALKAVSDRHGEDTEAFDMRGVSILADYYVVTSAGSNRQLHAIANAIIDEAREFYNLEKLWANGKQLEIKED